MSPVLRRWHGSRALESDWVEKMERRALLAIALSILVLLAFRYFEERRVVERVRNNRPIAQKSMPVSQPAAPSNQVRAAPTKVEIQSSTPTSSSDTVAVSRPIVVDCDLYRAVLDNRGGVITSWVLKRYKSGKGDIFEMIATGHSPESRPFPGSVILEDASLNWQANGEFYQVEIEGSKGAGEAFSPPVEVTLRLGRGDLKIEKRYRFERNNYLVGFSTTLERGGRPAPARILLGEDIGPEYEHLLNPSIQLQAVSRRMEKVHRDGAPKNENEVIKFDGAIGWVGLDMHYFSVIAIPTNPFNAFEIQRKPVKTLGLDGKEALRNLMPLTIPIVGSTEFRIFLGPKAQDVLEEVKGADLSGVIDFGMFSFLVRPLLYSLRWIDRYLHNYGVSIIVLTLLLTLLLFPIRLKQILSMKKMAVVQPKIKEIQEKYKRYKKTDPRRAEMNQEIMAVYKQHNVNPLGGCLPLILQMPLLFAFYQLLASSIELRQAPFVGWIQDLSVKDPYYVLPIIMGATMFISQRMTPMTPGSDPTQAKMMMMMPAVFTVMFLNVSSGLNLYFLCSNIFQIAFQKLTERWIGDGRAAAKAKA